LTAKKIYVENLNIGAGVQQKQENNFPVPLISSTNEDSWEDFFGFFQWRTKFSEGEHQQN
jgi:hypothetical protein